MDFDNIMETEETKKEQKDLDVLKELFIQKNIESKTELSINQIILVNQKRTIAKILGFKALDEALNDFMLLMISKNRLGRGEFVDGFKSERDRKIEHNDGFFSSFKNKMGFK